ncbi:hypothetical protein ACFQ93_30270 [Streptomyces sp. NPDC056601]|uniref:hypothetical protein n=1 Tax=Streptomyces sp. NPDC056601 TaxID=3345875 RepID=UPI003679AB39
MAVQRDKQELSKLGDALARPAIRKTFAQNPIEALQQAGVAVEKIPPEVVDLFADLSPWELEVLGRVAAQARSLPDGHGSSTDIGIIIH